METGRDKHHEHRQNDRTVNVFGENVADYTITDACPVPFPHRCGITTPLHPAELAWGHATCWPGKCEWRWSITLGRSFKSQCLVQPHLHRDGASVSLGPGDENPYSPMTDMKQREDINSAISSHCSFHDVCYGRITWPVLPDRMNSMIKKK